MKNKMIALLLSALFFSGFSQNFKFEHTGARAAIVSKQKIKEAKLLTELMPNYNGEDAFIEILTTVGGNETSAGSTSDLLTQEQKNLLNATSMGTDILVKIKYKNNSTGINSGKELEFVLTPGPETDAQYPGGNSRMSEYIKENVINKIPETKAFALDKVSESTALQKVSRITVAFVVNEKGEITDATINRTSADAELDELVLNAISKMPAWTPAEFSKGAKVKQKFIVSIPFKGGC
ncbi:MAG: TonB family protein [Bacteroidota bacterium]